MRFELSADGERQSLLSGTDGHHRNILVPNPSSHIVRPESDGIQMPQTDVESWSASPTDHSSIRNTETYWCGFIYTVVGQCRKMNTLPSRLGFFRESIPSAGHQPEHLLPWLQWLLRKVTKALFSEHGIIYLPERTINKQWLFFLLQAGSNRRRNPK